MNLAGLHVRASNPDPEGEPLKLVLLDAVWGPGESMSPVIDLTHTTPQSITRYRASAIKRVPPFPVGALRSEGGEFGALRWKPAAIPGLRTTDPLDGSDPTIANALAETLYDSSGEIAHLPFAIYQKKGFVLRTWVYQSKYEVETLVEGGWTRLGPSVAVWDLGPWNFRNDLDSHTGEIPQPAIFGQRYQNASTALLNVTDFEWIVSYSFRDFLYIPFNVFFAPTAHDSASFPGPMVGFVGTPTNGTIYTSVGERTLAQVVDGQSLNCGKVTWTLQWQFFTP